MSLKDLFPVAVSLLISMPLVSQQVADSTFNPVIPEPEYLHGKGPVVLIDEGHNNFHTAGGRYMPFARLPRALAVRPHLLLRHSDLNLRTALRLIQQQAEMHILPVMIIP